MKKALAILLILALFVTLFTSCAKKDEKEYKLGMGVVVSYAEEQTASAAYDLTVAAVILDADGKIVACEIDSAQSKVMIEDGFLQDGATALTFKTKYELGDDYNMKTYGGAIGEWYEQADAFEEYCVGKTADEVKNMSLAENGKATDSDLLSGCTIAVTDFKKAVVKALEDTEAVTFKSGEIKLGMTVKAYVASANDSENNNGKVKFTAEFAAVAVDSDSLLAAAVVDAVQPEFSFNDEGFVTEAKFGGTKRELKENYGMKAYAGSAYEWYEQAASLCDFLRGLSAEDIKTVVSEDGKAKDADLLASCTISISTDVNNIISAMSKI